MVFFKNKFQFSNQEQEKYDPQADSGLQDQT
jgi:hypothetical protein